MNPAPRTVSRPLPPWVILLGSILIIVHFLSLGTIVLAAPSGPWPSNFGSSPAPGPSFATVIEQVPMRFYIRPLHMANDYHFVTNVPSMPAVYFEARLKDEAGKVVQTLKYPDEKANFYVRHRQQLLAQALGTDLGVQPSQGGGLVLPQGKEFATVQIWEGSPGDPVMRLVKKSEVELPRDRPAIRPSDWSVLLAQAYGRYLCRQHGAASVEIVRRSRNAIMPDILFVPGSMPREVFDEQICSFGDIRP
jgi:hypothetical protein